MWTIFRNFIFCLLFAPSLLKSFEHDIAICAIFHNEARFMREWIEYHKLIGVTHFYLYDNSSDDDFQTVLNPYIERKEVTLLLWPRKHVTHMEWCQEQCSAYNDCLNKCRNKVKWVAFIDLDEFIVPVQKNRLRDVLAEFEDCVGVGINWQLYGTSDKRLSKRQLLIEALTKKAITDHRSNFSVKSIVKPHYASHFFNPHFAVFYSGQVVDTDKKPFERFRTDRVHTNKLRLNHYYLGDLVKAETVKWPRMNRFGSYSWEEFKNFDREICQIEDPIMRRFTPTLKQRMGLAREIKEEAGL